ncbi:hypothetical protein ACOJCM_18125 [Billgrantia sp. LNSP4103-1]|uniref:hypothetical protein n=1 Tax=Billgrantia sp. LNSP4103-1 TaxID=3410266 RepID=UPI00403F65F0
MHADTLNCHAFAVGFVSLAVVACLALGLLPVRQATSDFDSARMLVAVFPPGERARTSRNAIREVGALPRRALLGGMLVSFVAWDSRQVEKLERGGAYALVLPSRPNFALGCALSTPP